MTVPVSSTEVLEHLATRVRELEDVREIEALAARYHSLCDGGWHGPSHEDVDALVDLWVPDGTYDINAARPPCRGHAEIREQLVRLRTSMPWILHTFTNSEVDVEGDRASGRFKAVAYYRRSDEAHVVVGSYLGDFLRTPSGWRFDSWTADLAHGSVLSAGPSPAAARS